MSTTIPSASGTPQPTTLKIQVPESPAFTQVQPHLQQQQIQAQNMFRHRQLMESRQQQLLWQQRQLMLQHSQQQLHMQQQMQLAQQQQQQQQQQGMLQKAPQRSASMLSTTQEKINPSIPTYQGKAVLCLMQFSEQLDPGEEEGMDISFWHRFVDGFFTSESTIKWGLHNNTDNDQKSYEISQALIARFFHSHYTSGVTSIQVTIDKTMEYILPNGIMQVECPRVSIINKYKNGTLVVSKGPLWVQFLVQDRDHSLKITHMEFSCQGHEEYVRRQHIQMGTGSKKKAQTQPNVPESLINDWGLSHFVYQFLQIADATLKVSDVMFHSIISGSTPRDSLRSIASSKQPIKAEENSQSQPSYHQSSPIIYPNTTTTTTITTNPSSPIAARKRQASSHSLKSPAPKKKNKSNK